MSERTYAIPHCESCPPPREQTWKALITGQCCRCGGPLVGKAAAREIAARRLIERVR